MNEKQIIYRRKTCRACGSKNLELFFSLEPSPIGDEFVPESKTNIAQEKYPIDLFMCKDCNLFQLLDVIDPEILYGNYIYVSDSSFGLREHFSKLSTHLIKVCNLKNDSLVIDIGSNDGILLDFFKKSKMNVLGVEPARSIADIANSNGITTIPQYLSHTVVKSVLKDYGKAKLITSNNVFANVDNIRDWVSCISMLLDDNGVYVFESYYLLDVVKNYVFDFIYHEHLSSFSVKPIKNLFHSFGLNLIKVEHIDTKGGSLRYYLQKDSGKLEDDGSVSHYLKLEEKNKLYIKETYTKYLKEIQKLKNYSLNYLKKAKKDGKIIAGFGASITGTTLIHHFEIGEYIDYLIDDNSAKHGMFSPGLHLPVYPVEDIVDLKPDIVFVLAWRFTKHFLKRKKELKWNGVTVIPVPNFREYLHE